MKTLLSIAAVLALAASVNAQTYSYQSLDIGTNMVEYGETQTANAVMDVRKQDDVCFLLSFNLNSTGTGDQTLVFERSLDGTTWGTAGTPGAAQTVVVAATSDTTLTLMTNLPTYGCGWIRLKSWANGDDAEEATNIVCGYAIKIP